LASVATTTILRAVSRQPMLSHASTWLIASNAASGRSRLLVASTLDSADDSAVALADSGVSSR
jgi:hypothetical protein